MSGAITLDDPHLLHVLVHLFLWDPPSSLEDGYDAPDRPPTPSSANPPPPPPTLDQDGHARFVTVLQRCQDRVQKSTHLRITYLTEPIGPITLSSFDNAPSRATVLHGTFALKPIVLKLAEQDRDADTQAEGVIYRERLQGVEGVPKLYAEGWLYSNEHWVYCLVLEDLGIPLTAEGIQDADELDATSKCQLEDLKSRLFERGVVHDDVEPRNIIRTHSGGIGLVDFEGAYLVTPEKDADGHS
ncbi:hypothetical protein DFH06DRAFT_1168287 [Mycena polygramma]|nr:hypothetical protein DFH06DRAFT_1168287 [Mycena polygramma]